MKSPLRFVLVTISACLIAPGPLAASPIHEEMFVPIGGIEQWITIHGSNNASQVVLLLHGGTGDALIPYSDSLFAGW